jgi:hypothetical protein
MNGTTLQTKSFISNRQETTDGEFSVWLQILQWKFQIRALSRAQESFAVNQTCTKTKCGNWYQQTSWESQTHFTSKDAVDNLWTFKEQNARTKRTLFNGNSMVTTIKFGSLSKFDLLISLILSKLRIRE